MEFAWNTEKNKMADVKGKEMEQERKGKISNEEIDLDKTHLNYDLVESNKNLYQRVKDRVEEVRAVSRIQKNSVVDYSNIITVPKEQFKEWGLDKSKKYLEEVYNYFCEEFGKENVVSAKVHLDETTPHMHLHFVPVNKENGKLQARALMTPARINKIHTEAPKYLQEKGFEVERGKGKTEKSLDIHRYKAEKMKEDVNILESKLKALESDLKGIQIARSSLNYINDIEFKKSNLGSKISLKEEDFNLLKDLAKSNIKSIAEIEKLQRELERIESKSSGLGDENKNLKGEIKSLKGEIKNLKLKNKKFKSVISFADKVIGNLSKEFQDEFIKKRDEMQETANAPKKKTRSNDFQIGD